MKLRPEYVRVSSPRNVGEAQSTSHQQDHTHSTNSTAEPEGVLLRVLAFIKGKPPPLPPPPELLVIW